MKLYELPRKTKFRLLENTETPPAGILADVNEEYFFSHVDGMYSFCRDSKGNVVHLAAWSEVEKIDG